MTANPLRAADVLANRLYEAGCRFAFGMPGGEVLTLLDAFECAGIRFYLSKHENAGGFMAEGTWHQTGAPGVLLATIGPGVTNAVNVAANAQQDRVPLIIISGCIDPADQVTCNHQVLDHRQVFGSICKATFTMTAEAAGAMADKAVNLALQGRPGPVHIDVPISVAASPSLDVYEARRAPLARTRPAETVDLSNAREWLAEAQRPLLIVGNDAVADQSVRSIRTVANALQLPVLTTYKAKGIVPEDNPLVVGSFALSPTADSHVQPLVAAADVIVLAGCDAIELRSDWRDPWNLKNQRVIEFSTEPNEHYLYHSTVSFVGHVGEGLHALADGLTLGTLWENGAPTKTRSALLNAFGQHDKWGPAAIVNEVRANTPRDAIVTIDTGAHRIVASQVWHAYEPDTLLQSVGLGSMACALPLAVGVKLASPQRPVIALTGDGGLLMALSELSTISDNALPIVVVVFVDRSLALIEVKQRQRQLTNAGVDFKGDYDYVKLAEAFGGEGIVVKDRETLAGALKRALTGEHFSLLACEFPRQAYDGRL